MAFIYNTVVHTDAVLVDLQSSDATLKEVAREYVRSEYFVPATKRLQEDFEEHVVTRELDDGAAEGNAAGNPSNTLVGSSPKTLFTFIGFDKGDKPTNAIRNRLKTSSPAGPRMLDLPVQEKNFKYFFEIDAPDLEDIYYNTPLPWAPGLSWAEKLETGIPGLGRFIPRENAGRSGGGIEAKEDFRNGNDLDSKRIEYMSGIVRKFIDGLIK